MILTCPQCATRYEVTRGELLPDGRKVRCTKCRHVWHQSLPLPDSAPDMEAVSHPATVEAVPTETPPAQPREVLVRVEPPSDELSDRSNFARRSAGERAAIAAGWIAIAGIIGLAAWTGIRYRDAVASRWPQAAGFYAAIGFPVNARGLAFDEVNTSRELNAGRSILIVRGTVRNTAARYVPVPRIRIVLTDNKDRPLDSWLFSAGVERLAPGEKITFSSRRMDPPEDSRHLEMTFASPGS